MAQFVINVTQRAKTMWINVDTNWCPPFIFWYFISPLPSVSFGSNFKHWPTEKWIASLNAQEYGSGQERWSHWISGFKSCKFVYFPLLRIKLFLFLSCIFYIYIYQQCFLTKYSKQVLIKPDTLFSALRFSFRSQQMKQKYNSCSRTIMRWTTGC